MKWKLELLSVGGYIKSQVNQIAYLVVTMQPVAVNMG
tara:strand:- start:437 stop:547 length:111 start_codon:yes stop_codon:yes gene_type:complete